MALEVFGLFNPKLKKGIEGRKQTFGILKKNILKHDKTLWFHCASLGEFEQGLPVFKELRKIYPSHKFILSFFSPSGYEIRKNTSAADVVVYLPWDTKTNAKRFMDYVHPELIVFVKYEVWPNILLEAKNRNIKAILISALFRKDQIYFKFYGGLMKRALLSFDHIFTQNKPSEELLHSLGYQKTTISGDTRFDRVYSQLEQDNNLDFVSVFKQNKLCVVAGSTWSEDEAYFVNYVNSKNPENTKFIIAPHNINKGAIEKLKNSFNEKVALYSERNSVDLTQMKILIIDTIGLLTKIYSYANIGYVGGAAGNTGLHNTLEPAIFGVPIIIGNNYQKFPEAKDMIAEKGMLTVKNQSEFDEILSYLVNHPTEIEKIGSRNFDYIEKNRGAVIQITTFLRK